MHELSGSCVHGKLAGASWGGFLGLPRAAEGVLLTPEGRVHVGERRTVQPYFFPLFAAPCRCSLLLCCSWWLFDRTGSMMLIQLETRFTFTGGPTSVPCTMVVYHGTRQENTLRIDKTDSQAYLPLLHVVLV